MSLGRKIFPALILLTLVALLAMFMASSGPNNATASLQKARLKDPESSTLKKAEQDFYTVTDYSASAPADPKKTPYGN